MVNNNKIQAIFGKIVLITITVYIIAYRQSGNYFIMICSKNPRANMYFSSASLYLPLWYNSLPASLSSGIVFRFSFSSNNQVSFSNEPGTSIFNKSIRAYNQTPLLISTYKEIITRATVQKREK